MPHLAPAPESPLAELVEKVDGVVTVQSELGTWVDDVAIRAGAFVTPGTGRTRARRQGARLPPIGAWPRRTPGRIC